MLSPCPELDAIITDGLCIGCGLCAGISDDRIRMAFTPEHRERPIAAEALPDTLIERIVRTCPGLIAEGLGEEEAGAGATADEMWGYWHGAYLAWASNADTRFRASSGGVLSALSAFLLESGRVDFILHLGPDPDRPARSRWKISETPAEALDSGGSRYGPSAPLAGIAEAKRLVDSRAARFAFVGKPCDISAIRLLALEEPWLSRSLAYRLTIMCGGASEFTKTLKLLGSWGIAESDLANLQYRGNGNPGPTKAITTDGCQFETTYQELWEDESTWALQHRCKICPDAIGMAADLVSFDCWPGGGPTGEDEGFNAVMTRTGAGDTLLNDAVAAGALSLGRRLGADDFETFQPHQVRKRRAVWARHAGQRAVGRLAPETCDLGIRKLALQNPLATNLDQARGTAKRLKEGRGTEPAPRPADPNSA